MIPEREPNGWPSRPGRATGSRSDKKTRHARSIASRPVPLRDGAVVWFPASAWEPTAARLRLASNYDNAQCPVREAEPRMPAHSQAEPGNETQ
jgi:hypothetical protein